MFLFYDQSSVVQFKVINDDIARSPSIIQNYFGYLGLFVFQCEAEDCPFKICEELFWNFEEDYIESIYCF